jgi:imidazoleglycerol-phosphate dehydratase
MRKAKIERETKETRVEVELDLDGKGKAAIGTGIPFFDHMLAAFAKHSLADLKVSAKGDLQHHIVEDTGLCLGKAFCAALAAKQGINRFGSSILPMDEALAQVAVDLSGRSFLSFNCKLIGTVDGFDAELVQDFFQAFCSEAGCTMHIDLVRGRNQHHKIEAIFKCFGRALRNAVELDERIKGEIPSTKGEI